MHRVIVPALLAGFVLVVCSCTSQILPSFGVVPDFKLIDQTGAQFLSKEKLNGHVWIADFIYTTCKGPCPRMSSQMKQVGEALKDEPQVQLVSFTVDPQRDTPPVLAEYAGHFGADSARWHFLTGSRDDLHTLGFNAFHLNDVGGDLEHSTRFALIDGRSRIRGYYDSAEQDNIQKMIADARALIRRSRD